MSAPGYVPVETDDARIGLAPEAEWPELAFDPPLLRQGAEARVLRVPGLEDAAPLVLSRPGESEVRVAPAPGGGWTLVPEDLAPGAWTATVGTRVLPRALIVLDDDGIVAIDAIEADTARTRLEGRGFGRGAEAFALVGAARAPVPVPVRTVREDTLTLDALPDDTRALMLWTAGHWRAVAAPQGDATLDDPTRPAGGLYAPGVCGPADTRGGGPPAGALAVLTALVMTLRRKPGGVAGGG